MFAVEIDPHDPVRSLATVLGTDDAIDAGGILSVRIDRRLPVSAAAGAEHGTVDFCFELATVASLDDLALLGAMDETARWRFATVPARLEVVDGRLMITWSPRADAGARLIADFGDLVATCLAIQDMFERRRMLEPVAQAEQAPARLRRTPPPPGASPRA